MKIGVIVNNVGTPEGWDAKSLENYLGEFLMDPDVIGLPFPLRWLLVKKIIVPRRAKTSGEKYKKIWTSGGSPLAVETRRFAKALQEGLGESYVVRVGMRYGHPSIGTAVRELLDEGVEEIRFCAMYPQYAGATSFSSEQKLLEVCRELAVNLPTYFLRPFYLTEAFVHPSVMMLRSALDRKPEASVLFSFHGLPESHIKKNEGCLLTPDCCDRPGACEKNCYRAQCLSTARRIAAGAQISDYRVAFQSRLGPARWIGPSSIEVVKKVAAEGHRHLIVMTPAFVADGLESLEEIDMELRAIFMAHGGISFEVVPCLNAEEDWVRGFRDFFRDGSLWKKAPVAETPLERG